MTAKELISNLPAPVKQLGAIASIISLLGGGGEFLYNIGQKNGNLQATVDYQKDNEKNIVELMYYRDSCGK